MLAATKIRSITNVYKTASYFINVIPTNHQIILLHGLAKIAKF